MRIGSLFSGIGGFELGLEMSGLGHTVWQVEQDPFRRAVLAKHWPLVPCFKDVRHVGSANLDRVDVICGGFPCQDLSSAGKRAGLAGSKSGLWYEYLRIVSELEPSFVVVENVASGARAWIDTVCAGLGQQGYACLPVPLAASDVGAPHGRKRVFIIAAHANAHSQSFSTEYAETCGTQEAAAHSDSASLWQQSRWLSGPDRAKALESRHVGWRTPEPPMVRMVDELSKGLDKPTARRRALGDSVVPLCSEVIGYIIQELVR